MTFYNLIGLVGTSFYLLSYLLFQLGHLDPDKPTYTLMNLAAATCVGFSLLYDWNLPSMVIQVSWILISFVGIARLYRARRAANEEASHKR